MRKSWTTVAWVIVMAAAAGGGVRAQRGPSTSLGAGAQACDRACLESFVDRYLDAVIAHDPKLLPLSGNVGFTENAQRGTWHDPAIA